jgi:hypothetical protein
VPTGRAIWLPLAAVMSNGLLAGASLDQSIKQLPARHRIGVTVVAADFVLQRGVASLVPWWLTGRRLRQPFGGWAPPRMAGWSFSPPAWWCWCRPSSASCWRAWAPRRPLPRPSSWS